MAHFIGWLTAYKGTSSSETSRTSARSIKASARGWNVGGEAHVYAIGDGQKHSRDVVRLSVDGGTNGALMGYTVAWFTETDGKPELHIHLPRRFTMDHDFSRITLTDDETDVETVIYQAPAEGK